MGSKRITNSKYSLVAWGLCTLVMLIGLFSVLLFALNRDTSVGAFGNAGRYAERLCPMAQHHDAEPCQSDHCGWVGVCGSLAGNQATGSAGCSC